MKIILLNGLFSESKIAEAMSISYLAAYIKKNGFADIEMLDPIIKGLDPQQVIQKINEIIQKHNGSVFLGISLHTDLNKPYVFKIIQSIEEREKCFICVGGHSTTIGVNYESQYISSHTKPSFREIAELIDSFVMGEGELTLLELLETIEKRVLPQNLWAVGPPRRLSSELSS